MSYIDSISGCYKNTQVFTHARMYCIHTESAHTHIHTPMRTHTRIRNRNTTGRRKARSLMTNPNTNNNNTNNKKEAGVFLDSAFGCCKKRRGYS